jgi:DNA polymerase-3 subunit delta
VVVHDTKAFVSRHNVGELFRKSRDAWRSDRPDAAVRQFAQALAAAGLDRGFAERAAAEGATPEHWKTLLEMEPDDESEAWLREIAGRLATEGGEPAGAGSGGAARMYEELLDRGLPPGSVLILTAEVVDQRRALFKRVKERGVVVDCGVRGGKVGETQMRPEIARARIAERVSGAGKRIAAEAVAAIVDRTGFSVRALEMELEKVLLYIGERSEVRAADVLAVLSASREASIFDLTNALEGRDAGAAIRALRALATQREAAPSILGMMASTVRSLVLARCALDLRLDGRIDPQVSYGTFQARVLPRLAAEAGPDDGSVRKIREMHPFRAQNLLKAAGRFRLSELLAGLGAIHEADIALKTTGQPEGLILETLALALCGLAPNS